MNYSVKLSRDLIKKIGRVDVDKATFEPYFVLGEETKEWLNTNATGEWGIASPRITPTIMFSNEEDRNWFILRWS